MTGTAAVVVFRVVNAVSVGRGAQREAGDPLSGGPLVLVPCQHPRPNWVMPSYPLMNSASMTKRSFTGGSIRVLFCGRGAERVSGGVEGEVGGAGGGEGGIE